MTRRRWQAILLVGCLSVLASATFVNAQTPTLGGVLQAGKAVWDAADLVGKALSLIHRPLLQYGYKVTLQPIYQPEDGPGWIHMKHDPDEPSDERRIRLEATVEYEMDLENELPAATLREIAGLGLPNRGRVQDVRVRFWVPDRLLKYTEFRARDWDGMLPTWWKATDAMGVAAPHLYPITEQPLGGIRKVATGQVRAQAMVQATQGIPSDWIALGAVAAEELLFPTEAYATVSVEYHEPTEWEGSVTVSRSVIGSSRVTAPEPAPNAGVRTILHTSNENGLFVVEMPKVRLNKEGQGSVGYHGQLDLYATQASESMYRVQERMLHDTTDEVFRHRTEYVSEGHGEEKGDALIKIWVSPSRKQYAVVVEVPGCGRPAVTAASISGSTTETNRWNDDDGEHTETESHRGVIPDLVGKQLLQLPAPLRPPIWDSFDPNAQVLSGYRTWSDQRSAGGHTYTVDTTIEWELRRVLP